MNATVEAFKLPSSMPANARKLPQQRALKGLGGFDGAAASIATAPTPCASVKRLDIDDSAYGDDAVDFPDDGSEP
jgi:hypothetical protein